MKLIVLSVVVVLVASCSDSPGDPEAIPGETATESNASGQDDIVKSAIVTSVETVEPIETDAKQEVVEVDQADPEQEVPADAKTKSTDDKIGLERDAVNQDHVIGDLLMPMPEQTTTLNGMRAPKKENDQ